MGSRTETRLEIHRNSFVENDFHGALIRIEDLDREELELVNTSFLDRCKKQSVEDIHQIYTAYVETLHTWGVMCPHPQIHRKYEGWQRAEHPIAFVDARWYECFLCKTAVINR